MALNIVTDKSFDEALRWLARTEGKTKSDVIRDLILEYYANKRQGFQFGALASGMKKRQSSAAIQRELKAIDRDHDLD